MAAVPTPTLAQRALLPLAMASVLAGLIVYRRAGSPPLAPPPTAPLSSGAVEARAVAAPADATPVPVGALLPAAFHNPRYEYELAVFHLRAPPAAALARLRRALVAAGMTVLAATPPKNAPGRTVVVSSTPTLNEAPLAKDFRRFRGGVPDPDELARLRGARYSTRVVLRGSSPDALADYRAASSALGELEASAPGFFWDGATFEMVFRDAWDGRLAGWEAGVPFAPAHFVIEHEAIGDDVRLVTRGLEKLALPDLVVTGLTRVDSESMHAITNVVAQLLVERETLASPGVLSVDLQALRHPRARQLYLEPHASATVAHAVTLAEAPMRDGGPQNRLFELAFPGPRGELHQRHAALLSDVFVFRDEELTINPDDPGYVQAVDKARREAIALKPRVAAGLAVGESLHLKLPFEGPKGADDTENMWIDVQRWEGARVDGVLLNTPRVAVGLVLGSRVVVQESAILDYLFTDADGNERGDLTKAFAKPAASR